MKSFTKFLLTESITKADVQKWREDAYAFAKNINRIKSGKELCTVANAYAIFLYNLEEFVYKRLLGTSTYHELPDTYGKDRVREKMWLLVIERGVFIPRKRISYNKTIESELYPIPGSGGRGYPQYSYGQNWDKAYELWDKGDRSYYYTRYTRIAKEAFAALLEYMEDKEVEDKHVKKTLTIAGISVVEKYRENNAEQVGNVREAEAAIKKSAQLIKNKRLEKALRGLVIEIDPESKDTTYSSSSAGAVYDPCGDRVCLLYWGMNEKTICHEIGHRYYYQVISGAAKKTWDDWITKKMTYFTQKEIYEVEAAFWKATDFMKRNADIETWIRSKEAETLWMVTEKFLDNELTKKKYFRVRQLGLGRGFFSWSWYASEKKETQQQFFTKMIDSFISDNAKGQPFMLDFQITDYANTNPSEAYAETFSLYCTNQKLPGIVIQMFKIVSGLE